MAVGISNILALLGGVALFLFGMGLMGDSLKLVAGQRLELILYRLSNTPLKGVLLGTAVTAVFVASHIDCPPVGDMAGTITLLIQGAPELELHYTHRRGDALARLDTEELHALLGPELSLAEPELVLWIRDYLQEQEALLQEQKGM